ncbi:olfactory receptor 1500-like [Rhinoderma darwinii]|uniref:olfactory receptor 1500-like n=1 Tax=Rhinoderma darwinii TaxID=43563 RepID=UPI003F67EB1C
MVTEFFLLGFQGSKYSRMGVISLLLVIYCGTLCGNLLIITLVSTSKNLHTPMYFFLTQLSISDILLTTVIVPNTLHVLQNNGGTITFIDCITQLCFFCASETSECLLLTVMSYDRYVAICNPLRYTSIITCSYCVILAITCWFLSLSTILINKLTTSMLIFCGPNIIDHFFCDLVPLLDISCSGTFIVEFEIYILSPFIVIIPVIIIIISYVNIILTIFRIPSNISRHKAFSTCSSHLIVVFIFYCTMLGVYVFPTRGQALNISKSLSLLYTVFTPFINPIIYSLRNREIMETLHETVHKYIIADHYL